ncbi:hypothetical protein JXJ21_21835 [candidate division KSB1 bacterium]|nr:hypothetical protein [candidate division KSB1 bacterium]
MKCPPLNQLFHYLNDDLDSFTHILLQEHIQQCSGCKERVHFLENIIQQKALASTRTMSPVGECITENRMIALMENRMSPASEIQLLEHLFSCNVCFNRLMSLSPDSIASHIQEIEIPETLLRKAEGHRFESRAPSKFSSVRFLINHSFNRMLEKMRIAARDFLFRIRENYILLIGFCLILLLLGILFFMR